ncbi:hypothetical protein GCM10023075_30030 [Streptosporangium album]
MDFMVAARGAGVAEQTLVDGTGEDHREIPMSSPGSAMFVLQGAAVTGQALRAVSGFAVEQPSVVEGQLGERGRLWPYLRRAVLQGVEDAELANAEVRGFLWSEAGCRGEGLEMVLQVDHQLGRENSGRTAMGGVD